MPGQTIRDMEVKTALVSVIIVNFNGADYLAPCLNSLTQQSYPHLEIIVVDNASSDRSLQKLEHFQARHPERPLLLIENQNNAGFCRGNNQGISQASGEFVLLLNADVTLESECIRILVDVMNADSKVGIGLGKLLSGHDDRRIDSTGIAIHKTRRAVDRGQKEEDCGQYDSQEEVFGASGAACLYRRSMLEELKYPRETALTNHEACKCDEFLDELFFAYKEDIDLSWRARLLGWKCVYTPKAIGRHFRNWSTGKRHEIPRWIRSHSFKNRYIMLLKNERLTTLLPSLLQLIGYEVASLAYILVREPYLFRVFGPIIRAWPEILRKRRLTQNRASEKDLSNNLRPWFR